jgi:hypothetical protein
LKSWAGSEDPPGWVADATLTPPDLSQSPQVTCVAWSALRPEAGSARLVSGCFEAGVTTWAAEIEPVALEKIASIALSTALRVRSDATLAPGAIDHRAAVTTQSLAGRGARAITSIGFTPAQGAPLLRACMRVCVGDDGASECASLIEGAIPAGEYVSPPPPSFGLRATLAAVHHPRATATFAIALACALGWIAIATRRRPRASRAK